MPKNYKELFPNSQFGEQFVEFCEQNGLEIDFETGAGLNDAFRTFEKSGRLNPLGRAFTRGWAEKDYQELFLDWKNAITNMTMLVFGPDGKPRLLYYDNNGKLRLSDPVDEIWERVLRGKPEAVQAPEPIGAAPDPVPDEPKEVKRAEKRPQLGWFKSVCHFISGGRWFKADYQRVRAEQDAYDNFESSKEYTDYIAAKKDYDEKLRAMEEYKEKERTYNAQNKAYKKYLAAMKAFKDDRSALEEAARDVCGRLTDIKDQYAREAENERQRNAENETAAKEEYEGKTVFEREAIENFKRRPVSADDVEKRLDEFFAAAEAAIGEDGSLNRTDYIFCNGEPLTERARGEYRDLRKKGWPETYEEFVKNPKFRKERNGLAASLVSYKISDGARGDAIDDEFIAVYPPNAELKREAVPHVLNIGFEPKDPVYSELLKMKQGQFDSRDSNLKKLDDALEKKKVEIDGIRAAKIAAKLEEERKTARKIEVQNNSVAYKQKIAACMGMSNQWANRYAEPGSPLHVGKTMEQQFGSMTPEARKGVEFPAETMQAAARNIGTLLNERFSEAENTLKSGAEMKLNRCDLIYINGKNLSERLDEYKKENMIQHKADPDTIGAKEFAIREPSNKEIAAILSAATLMNYHVQIYSPDAALNLQGTRPLTLKPSIVLADDAKTAAKEAMALEEAMEVQEAKENRAPAAEMPAPQLPQIR